MKTKMMRITSLALAMLMIFSVFAGAVSVSDFTDFPDDWSAEAMTFAVENGLLQGYANNTIAPSKSMTRAEMATVLNRAFKAWKQASINFSDVSVNDWFYTEVSKAIAFETFKGTSETMFSPNGNITRAQAFTAIARALKLDAVDASVLDKYSDAAEIPTWAEADMAAMVAAGYVNGFNGTLKPNALLTRAEFAQVMYNIIKIFVTTSDVESVSGNAVVVASGLTLSNLVIDGDLIVGANVTKLSLNNVTIKGRLLVRDQYDLELNIHKSTVSGGMVVYSPEEVTTVYTDTVIELKSDLADHTTTVFPEKETGTMGSGGNGGGSSGSGGTSPVYYSVSTATAVNGSISVNLSTAAPGTVITVTATPDAGYELDKIYVNGVAISGTAFEALAADMIVSATFKAIDYTVQVTAPTNGSLTVDKTTANVGETVTVTATPDDGYQLVAIKVNGVPIVGNTFVMPTGNVVITAEFSELPLNTYSVSIGSVTNGTVIVDKNAAAAGETITVTATPSFGYQLVAIKVDGAAITGNTFTMPAKNVEVTAEFSKMPENSYSVTIGAVTNGSLVADKSSAKAGETITVTATPTAGYRLLAIKVNGIVISGNTFTMPNENVEVTAEFVIENYLVQVTAPTNGSLSIDKTVANVGDTITVTATPNTGYILAAIKVNGVVIAGNTFEMPSGNVTITAEFTKEDYNVAVVTPANGSLTVDKAVANYGDTITVSVTADAGYELSVIKVDGREISGNTFTMPAKSVEVTAEFYAISYAVNVTTPANGSLSANKTSATVGTTVTVTATPDAGYQLDAIKINGTAITGTTFAMPVGDVTITAEFSAINYAVSVATPANGTVVVNKSTAIIGETITVTATPDDNYKFDYITVDGVAYYTNTFTMPAKDVVVSAVFSKLAPNTYSVNIGAIENGSLTADKYAATAGETITITATPASGYALSVIKVNGVAITGNTFTMPAATANVTAEFTAIPYDVIVVAPTNGSLVADKGTAIVGETITVTATPDAGYRLAVIKMNGVAIIGNTFIMPAAEVTITAEFTAIPNTITVISPANGSVSVDKTVAIIGETVTVTAVADAGYELVTIKVDGAAITGNTFTMPATAVEVTAEFKLSEYNVTVVDPANGSVSVDKNKATINDVITVTATPDAGYVLSVIKVDGKAISGNTFQMKAADVEVTAEFVLDDLTITVVDPANGSLSVDKNVANLGDTITVTATPDTGYELVAIMVNGTVITGNTFTMPSEAVEVTAEFKATEYDVIVITPANGTVSVDKNKATINDVITVTATPDSGYALSAIKVDGVVITGNTFQMKAADVEVTAEFVLDDFTITVVDPANGSLSVNPTVANVGTTITVIATPDAGYKLAAIKVNDVAITGNTFTMPAEDVVVTAEFELLPPDEYSITIGLVENGSISADKTSAIEGALITVTAVPAKHYMLNKVLVNGVAISGTTFNMPAENVVITAIFKEIPYAIRVDIQDVPKDEFEMIVDTRYENDDDLFELARKMLYQFYGGRAQTGGLIKRAYDLGMSKINERGILVDGRIPKYEVEDVRTYDVNVKIHISADTDIDANDLSGEIADLLQPDVYDNLTPDEQEEVLLEMEAEVKDRMKDMTADEKRDWLLDRLSHLSDDSYTKLLLNRLSDDVLNDAFDNAIDQIPHNEFSLRHEVGSTHYIIHLEHDFVVNDFVDNYFTTMLETEIIEDCREGMKAMSADEKREWMLSKLPTKVSDKAPEKAMDAAKKALNKIPDADLNQLFNDGIDLVPDESFIIEHIPGDTHYTITMKWLADPILVADAYYLNTYIKNRALDKLAEYGITPLTEERDLYDRMLPSNFAKDMGDYHVILTLQEYYEDLYEIIDLAEDVVDARGANYFDYQENIDKAINKGIPKALEKAREKGVIIVDQDGNDITAEQCIAAAKAVLNNPDITVNELLDIFGDEAVLISGEARDYTATVEISRIDVSKL